MRRKVPLKSTGQLERRTPLKTRRDTKHERWSKAVKERDGWQCQFPGCNRSGNVDAHHLASKKQRPDLKYVVSNGVAVCRFPHHRWIHTHPTEATAMGLMIRDRYENQGER